MDLRQATDIAKHVHDAADAIDRASAIILALEQQDRAALADPLSKSFQLCISSSCGRFTIAIRICDRRKTKRASSIRYCDGRTLCYPHRVSEADLDQLILSALKPNRLKTARVVGDLVTRCEALAWPIDKEMLAARVQALAEAGRIESVGDLRAWRHSEVRLTGG